MNILEFWRYSSTSERMVFCVKILSYSLSEENVPQNPIVLQDQRHIQVCELYSYLGQALKKILSWSL